MRGLLASLLVLLTALSLAPAQTYTDTVTTTPIAIQDGFGPGGQRSATTAWRTAARRRSTWPSATSA